MIVFLLLIYIYIYILQNNFFQMTAKVVSKSAPILDILSIIIISKHQLSILHINKLYFNKKPYWSYLSTGSSN